MIFKFTCFSEVVQRGEMLFPKVYTDRYVITFILPSISPDAMLARDWQQGDLQSLARGGRRTIPNCQDQGLGWRGLRQPQWEDGLGNQVGFQGVRLCGSLWYLPGEADHREEGTTCQVLNLSLNCGMWTEQLKYSRFAYFTIPLTTMAAGWMGGVELSKISLGRFILRIELSILFKQRSWRSPPSFARDCKEAWLTGAIVPGGIMGIWTRWVGTLFRFFNLLTFPFHRNLYGGMRTSIFLGAFGWIYQYSTNNNLTNTISPN